METFAISFEFLRGWAQRVGPYLLIEAVLPGGTLLALLLWLYRARKGSCAIAKPLEARSSFQLRLGEGR